MELLLRRTQYVGLFQRVKFKLWARIELDETEQKMLEQYQFRDAAVLGEFDFDLLKTSVYLGLVAGLLIGIVIAANNEMMTGAGSAPFVAFGVGYLFYNARREVIYVRDLLHGRTFRCSTVVALMQKEAKLEGAAFVLRQVLEGSRHWDGTEKLPIDALPREEAKEVILKAFPDAD